MSETNPSGTGPDNFTTSSPPPTPKLSLKVLNDRLIDLQVTQSNMWDQIQERDNVLAAQIEELKETLSLNLRTVSIDTEKRFSTLATNLEDLIAARIKPNAESVTASLQEATGKYVEVHTPGQNSLQEDLLIATIEALRCAGINTAARMSNELEEKYFPEGVDYVLNRFPWMSDYR